MSLRTVAGDTPSWERSAKALEPTGSLVETKSRTIARSTSSLRSSSIPGHLPPSVRHEHLPHWHSGLLALLACWHSGLLSAKCTARRLAPSPASAPRVTTERGWPAAAGQPPFAARIAAFSCAGCSVIALSTGLPLSSRVGVCTMPSLDDWSCTCFTQPWWRDVRTQSVKAGVVKPTSAPHLSRLSVE